MLKVNYFSLLSLWTLTQISSNQIFTTRKYFEIIIVLFSDHQSKNSTCPVSTISYLQSPRSERPKGTPSSAGRHLPPLVSTKGFVDYCHSRIEPPLSPWRWGVEAPPDSARCFQQTFTIHLDLPGLASILSSAPLHQDKPQPHSRSSNCSLTVIWCTNDSEDQFFYLIMEGDYPFVNRGKPERTGIHLGNNKNAKTS